MRETWAKWGHIFGSTTCANNNPGTSHIRVFNIQLHTTPPEICTQMHYWRNIATAIMWRWRIWRCHVSRPVSGVLHHACVNHMYSWHWFCRGSANGTWNRTQTIPGYSNINNSTHMDNVCKQHQFHLPKLINRSLPHLSKDCTFAYRLPYFYTLSLPHPSRYGGVWSWDWSLSCHNEKSSFAY